MNLDLVMITTGSRPRLLEQSLKSLRENASNWDQHSLTLVMDGCSVMGVCGLADTIPDRVITSFERQGASRSRNIGASSTTKYLRKDAVCFFDDDVYACPGWDNQLTEAAIEMPNCLISGHAHPFNHTILGQRRRALQTTVLSTVHISMSWNVWDWLGFWAEPGGAGGSEDVDYCKRATNISIPLLLTTPQCILHTGIGSSTGSKLIGWEQVMENNRKLEKVHGIEGRVVYE